MAERLSLQGKMQDQLFKELDQSIATQRLSRFSVAGEVATLQKIGDAPPLTDLLDATLGAVPQSMEPNKECAL